MWTEPRPATHPTQAGGGGAEQLLQAGNRGYGRMSRGPRGAPWRTRESVGAAMLPVSTMETAGPGVALIVSRALARKQQRGDPG